MPETPQQRWDRKHPEKRAAIWKRYYDANRVTLLMKKKAYSPDYYKRNRTRIRAKQKQYYRKNAHKVRERGIKYRNQNKEKLAQKNKDWNERNRDCPEYKRKRTIGARRTYLKSKKKTLARHKRWRANNRALVAFYRMKRRAMEAGATINLAQIKEFIKQVRSKEELQCSYCLKVTPIKRIHIDHIIPLCKGGAHSVENLCVSCKKCNLQKGRQTPGSWIREDLQKELYGKI